MAGGLPVAEDSSVEKLNEMSIVTDDMGTRDLEAEAPLSKMESNNEEAISDSKPGDDDNHIDSAHAEVENVETVPKVEDQPSDEAVVPTRIGIQYEQDNKRHYGDAATRDFHTQHQSLLAKDFDITVDMSGEISLRAPALVAAFRDAVKFYPGVLNDSSSILLTEPYAPLYHYKDELVRAINSACSEELSERFFTVSNRFSSANHEKARNFIENNVTTFDTLWALYKPGELLISEDEFDQPTLHYFTACARRTGPGNFRDVMAGTMYENSMQQRSIWCIDAWSMKWDGSTRRLSRHLTTWAIAQFSGSRNITSLEVYPLRFYDGKFGDDIQSKLQLRGHQWKKLISSPPICQNYEGPAFEIKMGSLIKSKHRSNV